MQDEGFHEIQLSGKQLVFLCMATTVVSVLIFLCGVLVGRGVRAERLSAAAAQTTVGESVPAPDAPAPGQEPPPPADDLSYPGRLDSPKPTQESLGTTTPAASAPAPKPEPMAEPKPTATTAVVPPPAATPAPTAPAGRASGFMVQVASLRDRAEAEAIVKRLAAKGYPAFVLAPAAGGASAAFRVRVGGYASRREAEAIGKKLEKEEQFQPWITR